MVVWIGLQWNHHQVLNGLDSGEDLHMLDKNPFKKRMLTENIHLGKGTNRPRMLALGGAGRLYGKRCGRSPSRVMDPLGSRLVMRTVAPSTGMMAVEV